MKLEASVFNGLTPDEVEAKLKAGKIVSSSFGFSLREFGGRVNATILYLDALSGNKQVEITGTSQTCDIDWTMAIVCHQLFKNDVVEGFQVVNEKGRCFNHEPFEIIGWTTARDYLDKAQRYEPDDGWFVRLIQKTPDSAIDPEAGRNARNDGPKH